jgi:MoaA/NifB/PqqE/SkfB family radical SAM enzyme
MTFELSLLKYFIRRRLWGQKIPLLASFKLTYRCNLACRACPFHTRAGEDKAHMDWDTAVLCLESLRKRGTQIVVFEGGEPFLWGDGHHNLHDLVMHAKRLFPRVAVTTNGTFPLTLPADILWVSLDGAAETHNRLRSGSFERVWNHLESADHPNLLVHFTLNRENWQDMEPILKRLKAIATVRGMTVQLFYPYNRGEDCLSLSLPERKAAIESAVQLKKRGFPILNSERSLRAMIRNDWACHDDVLINVDPDGHISEGCYAKRRGQVNCEYCGFTPVSEASGAVALVPASLWAGWSIFCMH